MAVVLNPPRNGEGDREAVEGPRAVKINVDGSRVASTTPSVSPSGCHLPVPGRIYA
jgi:hypothetical protein